MQELAKEYRKSIQQLNTRIVEIAEQRKELASCRNAPDKDAEVIELDDRLKPLKIMLGELQEVSAEVRHYYDKGWWRSERITFNARKSKSHIYAGPSRR